MKLDLCLDEFLNQPVQSVWHALTDSRLLARWLMENDFEPRAGHRFTLRDPPTNEWRGWVECEVLELDAPRRMVWSWNGGAPGELTTRLVFELTAEGSGTRLILRHSGDASEAHSAAFRTGWTRKLSHLSAAIGPDYRRRVAFAAPRTEVFDAVATIDGLRGWWTPRVSGTPSTGCELRLDFDGTAEHIIMHVDESTRPSSVRWKCVAHTRLPDWTGTTARFELVDRASDGCELYFVHEGLQSTLECYRMCSRGWDRLLTSLAAYVETGTGAPFTSLSDRSEL